MHQDQIIFKDVGKWKICNLPLSFLYGFEKDVNDFLGNKKELYLVIEWVTHLIPLVHIKGKKDVGKTRFLIELGKFF